MPSVDRPLNRVCAARKVAIETAEQAYEHRKRNKAHLRIVCNDPCQADLPDCEQTFPSLQLGIVSSCSSSCNTHTTGK